MLTCITCKPKIEDDGREDGGTRGTPETVKSLTAQIKEIAVKVSGAYKCKSSIPTGSCRKGQRPNPDFDALTSEAIPFLTSLGAQFGGVEEWTAQVEPGIQITFVSLPQGGNDLRRIRFSRDMYDKWEAQRWWGENYDRIMELYNVQKFNQQEAPSTPSQSENGGSILPSDNYLMALENCAVSDSAEKDLERCMQRAGGSRTEREYKLNTFEGLGYSQEFTTVDRLLVKEHCNITRSIQGHMDLAGEKLLVGFGWERAPEDHLLPFGSNAFVPAEANPLLWRPLFI
nr:protein BREVIS RADIX-like [Ipomoea batatas]